MPIRPENRDRYPADWDAISRRVRDEAGNACERCGVMNGLDIRRGKAVSGEPVWRVAAWPAYMDGMSAETGYPVLGTKPDMVDYGVAVKVVLTVAHLDHQPENCERANLRAWCQRCHNQYDAPMRRRGVQERAKAERAEGDLFS